MVSGLRRMRGADGGISEAPTFDFSGAPVTAAATPQQNPGGRKGRGLNSIPVRFALLTFGFCALGWAIQVFVIMPDRAAALENVEMAMIGATVCLPALVTFLAARKLSAMIALLRSNTMALLDGDLNGPVDVECDTEVGGLADSFRAMVARLNSNILRMNILAYTDSITGLPNRAVISHILELSGRPGNGPCHAAMFFIDLDGFKRINDTYGHDAGDELLRLASSRIIERGFGYLREELESCTSSFGELCQAFPTNLVFARFAGDEFVALLPGKRGESELKLIAQGVVKSLEEPFEVFGNDIRIGASVGVARMHENASDPGQLLIHSDIAMYRAKEMGRNCVALFDVELMNRVAERTELEKDLGQAIEKDQLTLHYQPKICSRTHEIVGVEALARWHHPTRKDIPPDVFVPIAEQAGCMAALGEAVMRLAARQGVTWYSEGRAVPIAVNVSAVQFETPGFVRGVFAMLDRKGLDPQLLELELTETVAMSDYAGTKRRLDELRANGIRIAIDDFGTGYSNLSQLARLNFDQLKIDRSLVMGIGRNGKSEAMLEAIVKLSRALGHEVVAEGVETMVQMAFLQQLGCDQLQGYYIARPMPASRLEQWRGIFTSNRVAQMRAGIEQRYAAA